MASFKENWEKTDKTCPNCGQVTERASGLTRQNVKRLFSFNYKDSNEWIMTAVLIGMCILAWTYQSEKKAYNEFMENIGEYCMKYMSDISESRFEEDTNGLDLERSSLGLRGLNGSGFGLDNNSDSWIIQ